MERIGDELSEVGRLEVIGQPRLLVQPDVVLEPEQAPRADRDLLDVAYGDPRERVGAEVESRDRAVVDAVRARPEVERLTVEVKLPGRYRVSPQIAGAIKAVPGVIQVEAV